ncbi:T9SS type A sorting domain-containing protein [Lacibacter sp. MH-610]|jgi:hypothetical protein|uniref:T9SS type A sorting domain-containing protein n=1 Tax=Lacibacter sp. MH-610 TaxID=3020883 RepID=UPI00389278E7
MKVIFTLLSLLFATVMATAQTGTTYRLIGTLGNDVDITSNGTTAGGFRNPAIWRVVNSNGTLGTTPVSPASGARLQIFGINLRVQTNNVDLSAYNFQIQIRSEYRDFNAGGTGGGVRAHRGRLHVNDVTLTLGSSSSITLGWGQETIGTTVYYFPGYLRLEDQSAILIGTTAIADRRTSPNGDSYLNANAFAVSTTTDATNIAIAISNDADNRSRQVIRTNTAPPSANITNRMVARPGGAIYAQFPFFYAAGAAPGGTVAPLPMRLGDFTATRQSQGTVLRWTTVQEVNSDNFEIQQSTNAQNWKTIGTVKAAGSSGSVLNYQFEDNSVNSGVVYYRLKMNDLDTKFEYSSVARIQFGAGSKKLFAYPSPATTYTTISTDVAIDGAVTVLIYEMSTGRMVQQKVVNAAGNNFRLGLEGLQSGTYTVQLIKDGEALGRVNLMKQ